MPETREARLNRIDSEGCSPEDVAWMIAELRGECREEWRVAYEFNPGPTHPIPMEWEPKTHKCVNYADAHARVRIGLKHPYYRNVRIERRVVTVGGWRN